MSVPEAPRAHPRVNAANPIDSSSDWRQRIQELRRKVDEADDEAASACDEALKAVKAAHDSRVFKLSAPDEKN